MTPAPSTSRTARWEALAAERPELAQAVRLQRALVEAAYREPAPGHEGVEARLPSLLAAGIPVAPGLPLQVEPSWWRSTLGRVLKAAAADVAEAETLTQALKRDAPDATELARRVVARDAAWARDTLPPLGLDPTAVWTLAEVALSPALQRLAATAAAHVGRSGWSRGYCPGCGAWPALAELRGNERLRHLRCALCGSDWSFPRLACPFCGTRDFEDLSYLAVEGEEEFRRVDTCRACGGYLKAVAQLDATLADAIVVLDLSLAEFDVMADERGFARPGPPDEPPWWGLAPQL